MDTELKKLINDLLHTSNDLKAAISKQNSSSWFDKKGLVLFFMGCVLTFGGSWLGMHDQSILNDAAISGVKKDITRLEGYYEKLDSRLTQHMISGQHGNKSAQELRFPWSQTDPDENRVLTSTIAAPKIVNPYGWVLGGRAWATQETSD